MVPTTVVLSVAKVMDLTGHMLSPIKQYKKEIVAHIVLFVALSASFIDREYVLTLLMLWVVCIIPPGGGETPGRLYDAGVTIVPSRRREIALVAAPPQGPPVMLVLVQPRCPPCGDGELDCGRR
jgi:hypothetical protein